jgi:hypothetical protein
MYLQVFLLKRLSPKYSIEGFSATISLGFLVGLELLESMEEASNVLKLRSLRLLGGSGKTVTSGSKRSSFTTLTSVMMMLMDDVCVCVCCVCCV